MVLRGDRPELLFVFIGIAERRIDHGLVGEERDHGALPVLRPERPEHSLVPGRKFLRIVGRSEAYDGEIILVLPKGMGFCIVPAIGGDGAILRDRSRAGGLHLAKHRTCGTVRLLHKRRPGCKAAVPLRQREIRELHSDTVLHGELRLQKLRPGF